MKNFGPLFSATSLNIGNIPKQTFLNEDVNGQCVHEKVPSVISQQGGI